MEFLDSAATGAKAIDECKKLFVKKVEQIGKRAKAKRRKRN
jgi:hypothetical protein